MVVRQLRPVGGLSAGRDDLTQGRRGAHLTGIKSMGTAPARLAAVSTECAAMPHPPTDAPLIEWNASLGVGIEEIDAQHHVLVDLLNRLHGAMLHHRAGSESRLILDELVDYTRIHFAVEESLMRLFAYPDYEAHKASHDRLVEEVMRLRARLLDEGHPVTFELLHFLKKWLTMHILEEDKLYTPFFLSQGVQARAHKASWLRRLWGRRD